MPEPPAAIARSQNTFGSDKVSIFSRVRSDIAFTMMSLTGATSGRPKKARASAGVQSTFTVIFMPIAPVCCPEPVLALPRADVQLRKLALLSLVMLHVVACAPDRKTSEQADAPETAELASAATDDAKPAMAAPAALTAPTAGLPAWFDCLDAAGTTLIAAHRGGPGPGLPENSLPAFAHSVANGAIVLEVDVQTSADGILFLHHDDSLERTTTGTGDAAAATWSSLRGLSLRDSNGSVTAYPIITLREALDWADGKAILELDIKRGTDYDDVRRVVAEAGAEGRVIPIAYSVGQAGALASRFTQTVISAPVARIEDLDELEGRGLAPARLLAWTGTKQLDDALYQALDARGVEVIFGTLGGRDSIDDFIAATGNEEQYAEMAARGVDMLATDRPVEAQAALVTVGRGLVSGHSCAVQTAL